MNERTEFREAGTVEPWLTIDGHCYSREQCAATYAKAERGEPLTQEEARVVGGWMVHPLNGPIGLAPFVIGQLLMQRQARSGSVPP